MELLTMLKSYIISPNWSLQKNHTFSQTLTKKWTCFTNSEWWLSSRIQKHISGIHVLSKRRAVRFNHSRACQIDNLNQEEPKTQKKGPISLGELSSLVHYSFCITKKFFAFFFLRWRFRGITTGLKFFKHVTNLFHNNNNNVHL